MTDIVERLRDGTYCTVGCAKLCGDAAAEVERLRALLGDRYKLRDICPICLGRLEPKP